MALSDSCRDVPAIHSQLFSPFSAKRAASSVLDGTPVAQMQTPCCGSGRGSSQVDGGQDATRHDPGRDALVPKDCRFEEQGCPGSTEKAGGWLVRRPQPQRKKSLPNAAASTATPDSGRKRGPGLGSRANSAAARAPFAIEWSCIQTCVSRAQWTRASCPPGLPRLDHTQLLPHRPSLLPPRTLRPDTTASPLDTPCIARQLLRHFPASLRRLTRQIQAREHPFRLCPQSSRLDGAKLHCCFHELPRESHSLAQQLRLPSASIHSTRSWCTRVSNATAGAFRWQKATPSPPPSGLATASSLPSPAHRTLSPSEALEASALSSSAAFTVDDSWPSWLATARRRAVPSPRCFRPLLAPITSCMSPGQNGACSHASGSPAARHPRGLEPHDGLQQHGRLRPRRDPQAGCRGGPRGAAPSPRRSVAEPAGG